MKFFKLLFCCFLIAAAQGSVRAQVSPTSNTNDTITLAQAYMNLYLTEIYFDTIPVDRLNKIIKFENAEIKSITSKSFITENSTLYNFTNALFYQNQTKLLNTFKGDISRGLLRRLKSVLGRSISYYNSAKIDDFQTFDNQENKLYEMIEFDMESNSLLKSEIRSLKKEFNSLFNEDLYPDFQRIFLKAKKSNQFYIDSLTYFAGIYSMPLPMEITNNTSDVNPLFFGNSNFISSEYIADSRLNILSRYVQLKHLASRRTRVPRNFNKQILYEQLDDFKSSVRDEQNIFIKEELNPKVLERLSKDISRKFPIDKQFDEQFNTDASPMIQVPSSRIESYFFPNPAPRASANFIKSNYKSSLSTLGHVDSFLSSRLNNLGYNNQLHYYYDMDGFALTTSLEKFNTDGSTVPIEQRFTSLEGDGKFSYFEIFKSMFFKVESEFRMFAFIVASKPATMSNEVMTTGFARQILKNSYNEIPEDLRNKRISNKVLSVFVYHFHQNDIGQVPELDLTENLTAQDYLKKAGLNMIIE